MTPTGPVIADMKEPAPVHPLDPASPAIDAGPSVDVAATLRRHQRFLLIVAIAALVVGVAIWAVLRAVAPEFSSSAQLLVTGGVQAYEAPRAPGATAESRAEALTQLLQNQIVLLRSDEVLNEALSRQAVKNTAWYRSLSTDDVRPRRLELQEMMSATPIRTSAFIGVTLRGGSQGDLPIVLENIIDVFLARAKVETERQSSDVRRVFVEERREADAEIARIHEQLKRFRIENDLPTLEPRTNEASISYEMIAGEVTRLEVASREARARAEAIEERAKDGGGVGADELAAAATETAVQTRDERMRLLTEQRKTYLDRFGENHRQIKDIDAQLTATRAERDREFTRVLAERRAAGIDRAKQAADTADAQLAKLRPKLAEAKLRVADLTQKSQDYQRLVAAGAAAEKRRDRAAELIDSVRVRDSRPDNAAVKLALGPSAAELTFPRLPAVVIATMVIVTGFAAVGVVLREASDKRVRSPTELRSMQVVGIGTSGALVPLEVLAVIPDSRADPGFSGEMEHAVLDAPTGLIAESARQCRAAVAAPLDRGAFKTLMLISAEPEAGVSSVLVNLAVSLARSGKRVGVIDANLRRPALHQYLGVPRMPGLVECLRGQTPPTVARHAPTGIDVLAAGDTKDARPEMLESQAMRGVLKWMSERYDVVLIDAPPVLLSGEGASLAGRVDAVAMVVRAMRDHRGAVARAVRLIESQGANVLGVVLNRARPTAGGYFRENFEAYYRYTRPRGEAA